jgi:hypothetical protein
VRVEERAREQRARHTHLLDLDRDLPLARLAPAAEPLRFPGAASTGALERARPSPVVHLLFGQRAGRRRSPRRTRLTQTGDATGYKVAPEARDYLLSEELKRVGASLHRESGRAGPEVEAVEASTIVQRENREGNLLRRPDKVTVVRELVGVLERGRCALASLCEPNSIAVVGVKEVLLDLMPASLRVVANVD